MKLQALYLYLKNTDEKLKIYCLSPFIVATGLFFRPITTKIKSYECVFFVDLPSLAFSLSLTKRKSSMDAPKSSMTTVELGARFR